LSLRLARLRTAPSQPAGRAANTLLSATFGAVLVTGIFQTVAHTACCFLRKH
jgi:hypothetical protein